MYWDLKYWKSGECQVVREKLTDLRQKGIMICPDRKNLFRALKETSHESCKVAFFGQDPYPNPAHATGVAFDLPVDILPGDYPPTFVNILKEYKDDLHYPEPNNGSLKKWTERGCLLWNVIPSCNIFSSMSHASWVDYHLLTQEIIERLNEKDDVVYVFLGGVAKNFAQYVKKDAKIIFTSHPSPRANLTSNSKFLGSRLFTRVNDALKEPLDWRLS